MGGKSSKTKDAGKKKQQPTISEEDINLLLANTNFTREEIISLHRDFYRDCPSGKINSKEFVKKFKSEHLLEKLKKSKPEKYCEYAFNAFDRNHDNFIDFKEFCVAFSVITSGDLKQKVQFAFRHFDADRDEKINKNDLVKVVTSKFLLFKSI
jgi:Ca2+-binding EF-hand superfamily protein